MKVREPCVLGVHAAGDLVLQTDSVDCCSAQINTVGGVETKPRMHMQARGVMLGHGRLNEAKDLIGGERFR